MPPQSATLTTESRAMKGAAKTVVTAMPTSSTLPSAPACISLKPRESIAPPIRNDTIIIGSRPIAPLIVTAMTRTQGSFDCTAAHPTKVLAQATLPLPADVVTHQPEDPPRPRGSAPNPPEFIDRAGRR